MAKSSEQKQVRLQIPIHPEVAAELHRLADGFQRPAAWMVRELLEEGLKSEEDLFNWITARVMGAMLGNKREKMHLKLLPDCGDVKPERIQVNVSSELANRIDLCAKKQFRSSSNMASMVIVRCLDEEAWLIRFAQSKLAAPLRELVAPKKTSKKRRVA